jgi:uncharacterized RDD family membrane protein YckC
MTSLPAPAIEMTVGRQGHYAGAVSRLLAFAADVGALWGLFTLGAALLSFASELVSGRSLTITHHQILATVLLVLWAFAYFSYPWAVSGKSIGMAVFGLRVVTAEGAPITTKQAVLRTLCVPLTFLTLGLGFAGIVFNRERRALHDRLVGTAVVYAWDARAARLRWMARKQTPLPHP